MTTRLTVVRHGRTACNVDGRYLGALDPPLDETGVAQAHAPAAAWDLPCRVVAGFAERDVGIYEGLTQDEARAAWPALWAQDITRRWDAAPPGGERIAAVFARVAAALDGVRRDYPDQRVVLVAHGFVAKVVRALLLPLDRDAFFAYTLENGAAAHYVLAADGIIDPCPPALVAGFRPMPAK